MIVALHFEKPTPTAPPRTPAFKSFYNEESEDSDDNEESEGGGAGPAQTDLEREKARQHVLGAGFVLPVTRHIGRRIPGAKSQFSLGNWTDVLYDPLLGPAFARESERLKNGLKYTDYLGR